MINTSIKYQIVSLFHTLLCDTIFVNNCTYFGSCECYNERAVALVIARLVSLVIVIIGQRPVV